MKEITTKLWRNFLKALARIKAFMKKLGSIFSAIMHPEKNYINAGRAKYLSEISEE